MRWPTQYKVHLLLRRCFHLQMAYASSLLRMHVFYHNELLIFLWQMLQITCLKITNFTSCFIDLKWRHIARAHVAPCISEILHRVQKCTWHEAQYWCHFPMRVKARLPTFPTINRRFYWMVLLYGPRQANLVLIAYASSEGSGEPAHPRSLATTFAARSYKQWIKRNLQTESQITGLSEWMGMRSWNLSWRNARRHKFACRGSYHSVRKTWCITVQ